MSSFKIASGLYKLFLASTCLVLALLLLPSALSAQSQVQSGSISQGFEIDDSKVTEGALVSIKSDDPGAVELSGPDGASGLVGVISDNPLIELGDEGNVKITTNGTALTLVSNINGDIKTGDKITASPILGVGQKATTSTTVVGTALTDLSTVSTTQRTITDSGGTAHTVDIGLLPVQVDVSFYTADYSQTFVPVFLQEFANSVAGKQVGVVQLFIAVLVLLLAFVSVGMLLYGSVKSSIISIGRNPLSEHFVRKGLWQASFAALGILAATIVIVLLVIRL